MKYSKNKSVLKLIISTVIFILIINALSWQVLSSSCWHFANRKNKTHATVKNIILFIGDGMGISQITASRIKVLGANGRLAMETMPVTGLMNIHSLDNLITDSAAGSTALATGYKTKNGMVGVTADSISKKTILEVAREAGMSTGLVATSSITHATPACFASHVPSRKDHNTIALHLIQAGVEVLLGGGKKYFMPDTEVGGVRKDGQATITILILSLKKCFHLMGRLKSV